MAKKKILVIDDDPDIIEFARVVLESNGYDIACASNKEDGLRKIKEISPELIILDVMMEKMSDGFDLSRKLKSEEKYKHIPILILTAVGEMTGFTYTKEAGDDAWLPVDEYVDKPVSAKELVSKVKKLLGGSGK